VLDTYRRQPCFEHLTKARPIHTLTLTAAIEPLEQNSAHAVDIRFQAAAVAADTKVRNVSLQVPFRIIHHGASAARAQLC